MYLLGPHPLKNKVVNCILKNFYLRTGSEKPFFDKNICTIWRGTIKMSWWGHKFNVLYYHLPFFLSNWCYNSLYKKFVEKMSKFSIALLFFVIFFIQWQWIEAWFREVDGTGFEPSIFHLKVNVSTTWSTQCL